MPVQGCRGCHRKTKYVVQFGTPGDGTVAADLNGDGRREIAGGPYPYTGPPEGPLSGPWVHSDLAPGLCEDATLCAMLDKCART